MKTIGLKIKSLFLTGQLEAGKRYDFDYDNQIISHEKYDAKPAYKKNTGYFPGVATIGDKIVCIENRDGKLFISRDGLATRSMARSTIAHELQHYNDFQNYVVAPIRAGNTPSIFAVIMVDIKFWC